MSSLIFQSLIESRADLTKDDIAVDISHAVNSFIVTLSVYQIIQDI